MKRILNFCLISFAIFLLTSCGKECKSYTQYETAPIILEYFGNYKPDNYWIYENQDGTKRDSMWVSDYVESKGGSEDQCFRYPVREFVLHSKYWGLSTILIASVSNGGNCCISEFKCIDTLTKAGLGINSDNLKNLSAKEISEMLISLVGIRKFYSYNLVDTFTLTKYYIK